jgi:metallo-beta-lactamase family protein
VGYGNCAIVKGGQPVTVPTLTFLGATGTVTGSRFLLDSGESKVLVDCGMYQGLKPLRQRNWEPFPFSPSSIDAVVLTHAHLDHSGMIPGLWRQGYKGPVFASAQTAALAAIVMADSGHLQEEEAEFANSHRFSKHSPAVALYTEEDALEAAKLLHPIPFAHAAEIASGVSATLLPAGHILGSSTVTLTLDGPPHRTLFFSGDVGRPGHPILRPPASPSKADVMLVESTYGSRVHEPQEVAEKRLADAVSRTAKRGGTVVIPSFAVDRTEVVLFMLRKLSLQGRIPRIPVYADSPMALSVLKEYRKAIAERDPELRIADLEGADPFDPGDLEELRTPEESKRLNDNKFPSVIISASGMATGGRVLHHLARCLPDPRCTVLLPGFQAAGTRGRTLADGARSLKLLGRYVPVRAEVEVLDAFSGHADRDELLEWLKGAEASPEAVFVVHGEPEPAEKMAKSITADLGWVAAVPRYSERVRVD